MNDRTMIKVRCDKELLYIRTISWQKKSPHRFAILRSELQKLEQEPNKRVLTSDWRFLCQSAADKGAGWYTDPGNPVHMASGRWQRQGAWLERGCADSL